ncbi:hypothetical protein [Ideonella sp.]|uniref:hypothetical protein n=1 Tax=Ideonella sp. TaxID=1929293 RepID=UPI002B45E449|nr:hypothetical protein [Ideonella sp.]HJV68537.1 hypothetical protein [Ideonella sp.]
MSHALAPAFDLPRAACGRAALSSLLLTALPVCAAGPQLAIEFIDSPGTAAHAINRRGDVVGAFAEWPCGDHTQCPPAYHTAVWPVGGARAVLPTIGNLPILPSTIDDAGQVAGTLSDFATASHAVVWDRIGGIYQLTDLGTLPGYTGAAAAGMDAQGRVVGHASGPAGFRPFVWTAAGGLLDLAAAGFPLERPGSVSPGGWVVSDGHSYSLDDVTSVAPLPAPPPGFYPAYGFGLKINDRRELAGFLMTTTGQSLSYLHRYRPANGAWQLLSNSPNGHLSRWGIGSLATDATVSATVTGVGVIADGPDGLAQALDTRLSPAYPGASVTIGGPANDRGAIAALALIGRSQRLVRLQPITPCTGTCLQVSQLVMSGKFIEDPDAPGSCTPKARNKVRAVLTVTDALGQPQAGVKVRGRFLDDYDLNQPAAGKTGPDGRLALRHEGPACVGAVAFFVDALKAPGAHFDRSTGQLTDYVIPLP